MLNCGDNAQVKTYSEQRVKLVIQENAVKEIVIFRGFGEFLQFGKSVKNQLYNSW